METDIFKQKLRERLWKIEGVMNELKNHNGLLRAKYRGQNLPPFTTGRIIFIDTIGCLVLLYILGGWSCFVG